jgi:hypothetical protein
MGYLSRRDVFNNDFWALAAGSKARTKENNMVSDIVKLLGSVCSLLLKTSLILPLDCIQFDQMLLVVSVPSHNPAISIKRLRRVGRHKGC